MYRHIKTIKDAAQEWVREMNAIPYSLCEKLLQIDYDELWEITPPSVGDRVILRDDDHSGEYGEILKSKYDGEDDLYLVSIVGTDDDVVLMPDEFEACRDTYLPMWGTLWSFGDTCDDYWLEHGGLQLMADCGFRIYEQEDLGYIFGIDGAGYDFYEAHWIPLYKARGLRWHDSENGGT